MATYCYVEVMEGYIPSTKSTAVLQEDCSVGSVQSSQSRLSSSNSVEAAPVSPHWNLTNTTPSFIIRVPNESIIKLFSFLVSLSQMSECCVSSTIPFCGCWLCVVRTATEIIN